MNSNIIKKQTGGFWNWLHRIFETPVPTIKPNINVEASHLIIWEEIARLNGKANPKAVAETVMDRWGDKDITPETTREIIRHLRSWNNAMMSNDKLTP